MRIRFSFIYDTDAGQFVNPDEAYAKAEHDWDVVDGMAACMSADGLTWEITAKYDYPMRVIRWNDDEAHSPGNLLAFAAQPHHKAAIEAINVLGADGDAAAAEWMCGH